MVTTLAWTPTPRQAEVLSLVAQLPEEEYAFIGYGGAAGGAKTNLLANLAGKIALSCPGSRTLVGRHTFKDLRTTTLEEFDRQEHLHACVVKTYDSGPVYRDLHNPSWPEGVTSRVYFREVKDARNGIGSEEYGWILLEEAHEIDKQDILYLLSRLRHRPERKRGMVCAFNPFPSYVVDVFIEGSESLPSDEGKILHQSYVPARIPDNPHLPPNYEQMMGLAYSNDPYMLAVLLKGEAGVVPNAIFPEMHDPEIARRLRVDEFDPRHESVQFARTGEGFDWGTSQQHQSAIVCASVAKDGMVWIRDAWMSPLGSSEELVDVASDFKSKYAARVGRYDASQGSLADGLARILADVDKGVRDVDGRIRVFRGLLAQRRIRFDWRKPGVRLLWQQLAMYHRDDDGEIVEERDDLVDACMYIVYELEKPRGEAPTTGRYQTPVSQRRVLPRV